MATGRTSRKHLRVYVDQYGTFNNDFFSIGPLLQEYDAPMGAAFADEVKNLVGGRGQASISAGVLQGYLNAGAGSLHASLSGITGASNDRIVSVLFGIRAAP